MKTSLICLLLLAAVACAAPRAGEMPGEKRVGMAEKIWEKMTEKRKDVAEEKREENAVAAAKSDGEPELKISKCIDHCHGPPRGVGCFHDDCDSPDERIYYDSTIGCWCCDDYFVGHCY